VALVKLHKGHPGAIVILARMDHETVFIASQGFVLCARHCHAQAASIASGVGCLVCVSLNIIVPGES